MHERKSKKSIDRWALEKVDKWKASSLSRSCRYIVRRIFLLKCNELHLDVKLEKPTVFISIYIFILSAYLCLENMNFYIFPTLLSQSTK